MREPVPHVRMPMPSFITEVKERKLIQWSVAYLAGGWAVLEVLAFLSAQFGLSPVLVRAGTVVVGGAFVGALVVAWYHGRGGSQGVRTPELLMLAAVLVATGALVVLVGSGPSPAASAERRVGGNSIAVLPFVSMSGDVRDEYFGDGLTEELLNALAQVDSLRVAARTSSFAFKDEERPIQEIGALLNVSHVLEGSVRRGAGGRLRITAQLIDTGDGFHRWSRTWDRQVEDVFEIQEEISRAIVRELRMQLTPGQEAGQLARVGTGSYAAYDLYLRGLAGLNHASDESLERSIELFEAALAEDPGFAEAHVGISQALLRQGIFYVSPAVAFPRAMVAANRAIELNPKLSDAYVAKAFINTEYEWNWEEADRLFRKGLEMAPGKASSHQWYQNLLRDLGRCEEAVRHGRIAARLDPLSPIVAQDLAYTHYYCRDYNEAVRRYREAVALDSAVAIIHMRLGMALSELGRYDEAVAAGQRAVELSNREPVILAALARTLADAGRTAEARHLLFEIESLAARRYVDGVYLSAPYTGLGDFEEAIRLIGEAHEMHSPSLVSIRIHPWHDPLRADPRFAAIQEQMRLAGPPPAED